MIKIYRVANGEDLNGEGEREKANGSFLPHFVHVRNDDGEYFLVVIPPEVHKDFTLMDSSDPEYDEIYKWVSEDGFVDDMFDPEITSSIN